MRTFLKKTVVAIASAALCMTGANAGFMDDFYTAAGAAANITPAQTVRTQGGTFVTGGSTVWRVPQRSFTPFNFQAPSMKAGCGGIDFFAGSFGFANSAEFVNYLRNIGQNAVGLFFQLALESMSPQLAKTIKQISDDIQRMNNYLGNSCQMAKQLVNATGWPEKIAQKQAAEEVAGGGTPGIYDAYNAFKTNLAGAIGVGLPAAQANNSGGSPSGKPEKNITWLAINSGSLAGGSTEYRNIVLSMLGTTVYRRDPGAPDRPLTAKFTPLVTVDQLAGRWNSGAMALDIWDCGSDLTDQCLAPSATTISNFKPLATKSFESLKIIRDAIITRQDISTVPGGLAAMQMLGTTRLPVFKVLEVSSSPGMIGLSDAMIEKFADLMGWEMATAFIETLSVDVGKAINDSKKYGGDLGVEDLEKLEDMLKQMRAEAKQLRMVIEQANGSQSDLIAEVQHLERALYTSFNLRLMDNLKYAMQGK